MPRASRVEDPRELSRHFRFGRNWRDYSRFIDEKRIAEAVQDMERLIGPGALEGKTFLDIGSGSGLHSLAALRLGCAAVSAIDLDPESVETTRGTLTRHAPRPDWTCREQSVLALAPETMGTFDIVYSWGVLHHTGAMWEAVARAADLVARDGLLVIALYAKTPFCGFWKVEKRLYAHSPGWIQGVIRALFMAGQTLRRSASGRLRFRDAGGRGMRVWHDAHDWLGGYPYESASPDEVERFVQARGFRLIRTSNAEPSIGLFGSGCAEYVFRRSK